MLDFFSKLSVYSLLGWSVFGALVLCLKAYGDQTHEFRPKISDQFVRNGLAAWFMLFGIMSALKLIAG